MCILTPRKKKTSKNQASNNKTKQQQTRIYCPFQPPPEYRFSRIPHQIYQPPPAPPSPPERATNHTSLFFSRAKNSSKFDITRKTNKGDKPKQDQNMPRNPTPLVAVNAWSLSGAPRLPHNPNTQYQQVETRYQYATAPIDWTYDQYQVQQNVEIERYRKREDLFGHLLVDSLLSRNQHYSQSQPQPQTQENKNTNESLHQEFQDLKKQIAAQTHEKEIADAIANGRKEAEEAAKKAQPPPKAPWEAECEYGTFERSRGPPRPGLEQSRMYRRPVPPSYPGLGYGEQQYGYDDGYYGGGRDGKGCLGQETVDGRLKGIEGSQQRMEQRFRFEDERRKWEKEYRQEDLLLRLGERVDRLGRY